MDAGDEGYILASIIARRRSKYKVNQSKVGQKQRALCFFYMPLEQYQYGLA